jgi:hypothetical protein
MTTALNDRMSNREWIGKDVEGTGVTYMKTLSRETEVNHERP